MRQEDLICLIIYIIFIQFSLIMLVYFISQAKKSTLLYIYIFIHVLMILWILRDSLLILAISYLKYVHNKNFYGLAVDLINWKIPIIDRALMAFGWLFFCLNYVGWKYAKRKKTVSLLATPTIFLCIMCITNNFHNFFNVNYNSPGVLFYAHAVLAYIYGLIGFVVLIGYTIKSRGRERTRTILLVTAYYVPIFISLVNDIRTYVIHLPPILNLLDLSSLSFIICIILIAFIIFKYRFLNIKTIALNTVVESLIQSVIIVDTSNNIISFNQSFENTFPYGNKLKSEESISFFNEHLKFRMNNSKNNSIILEYISSCDYDNCQSELILDTPKRKFYSVAIYPITQNGRLLGRIISFEDITIIKGIMSELSDKNNILSALNKELITKNEQLLDYASTAEELAIIKERNRFSRDVHDTLGHTMTVLITELKVISILCGTEPDKAGKKVSDAIGIAKNGLNELRRSISGLRPSKLNENSLEDSITKLISNFDSADIKIDFTYSGVNNEIAPEKSNTVYRVCQEALTNSLRHGKAKHVDIVLNYYDNMLKLLIKDDGCGCTGINKGLGLKGMEERVRNLGGEIQYGSDGENGFNIFVEIPSIPNSLY